MSSSLIIGTYNTISGRIKAQIVTNKIYRFTKYKTTIKYFNKYNELANNLLTSKIDIGIYTYDQLTTNNAIGYIYVERDDPREALIFNTQYQNISIKNIKNIANIKIYVISNKCKYQFSKKFPSSKIIKIDNISKLIKQQLNDYDAAILPYTEIKQLRIFNNIKFIYPINEIVPSVGQGNLIIGIIKTHKLYKELNCINNILLKQYTELEQNILNNLQLNNSSPIGIHITTNTKIYDNISIYIDYPSIKYKTPIIANCHLNNAENFILNSLIPKIKISYNKDIIY